MAKYMKTEDGYQEIEITVSPITETKMDKNNPIGTGSFSMGRQPDSVIGDHSHAEGSWTTASGSYSHAEGFHTTASGYASHAEGAWTTASNDDSHAEGFHTIASGSYSHAEGRDTTASGQCSHAEGFHTTASGQCSHAEGKYNIEDTTDKYAHIVGNGTNETSRSNAHTLDWSGNAWFAGTVEGKALILPSSTEGSTKKFKITVDDSGAISATEVI